MRRYLLPCFLLILDILILGGSALYSMYLRFPDQILSEYLPILVGCLPLLIVSHVLFYFVFRLYSRVWKYAGIQELLAIVGSNFCGIIVFYALTIFADIKVPRSVYILTFLLTTFLISGSRFILRYLIIKNTAEVANQKDIPVLIIGAGDAGNIIKRDIQQRDNRYVVGFIDDDATKWGQILNGSKIFGGRDKIADIVEKYDIKEILIAIPSLPQKELYTLAQLCTRFKCEVKVLPSFFTSLDAPDLKFKDLRPLAIEDLLDRDPITLDVQKIGDYITGKVVLVTGAGGSIGSEICRQVMRLNPKKLIMLGRGENSIYEINRELQQKYSIDKIKPIIANITNRNGMEEVFKQEKPQVVFHAAAHKHVPLMEAQPMEAIYNNVGGSLCVGEMAGLYGVERLVLISTDKAVNPTSVMGATKRVTEKVMQALNKRYTNTKYMAVRFGNVLGSRGSVVPLFKRQIAAGGPVTVTAPEMKRYFMTIPEASQLVLQAGAMGEGGEVFVLDMGKPVKIIDLAKNMIRLSGLEPDVDIPIKFTGLRPGEKMFEELLTAEEGTVATKNAKIFKAILHDEDSAKLKQNLTKLFSCRNVDECIEQLKVLLPTYTPNHF